MLGVALTCDEECTSCLPAGQRRYSRTKGFVCTALLRASFTALLLASPGSKILTWLQHTKFAEHQGCIAACSVLSFCKSRARLPSLTA